MKITCSGNGFGLGNASKRHSGSSKNQIFGLDRKMVRAQWKSPVLAMVLGQGPEMLQNNFLEAPKTRYLVQTEKLLARNENKPFWQWFWARSQKCFKTVFWMLQKPDWDLQTYILTWFHSPQRTLGHVTRMYVCMSEVAILILLSGALTRGSYINTTFWCFDPR